MSKPADPAALKHRLEQLAPDLPFDITIRPMMGGFIGYADGKPFVSLSTGGFGVKLLPGDQQQLLELPGSGRMRHSPSEPASKTYITLPADVLADDLLVLPWLTLAARTAPPATRRRPKAK